MIIVIVSLSVVIFLLILRESESDKEIDQLKKSFKQNDTTTLTLLSEGRKVSWIEENISTEDNLNPRTLIIGDWVRIKDYPMIEEIKQMSAEYYTRSLVEIKPIPLTKDILKVNSEWESGPGNLYTVDGLALSIELTEKSHYFCYLKRQEGGYSDTIRVHFKYVHELQHLLYFCGLYELAGNFKL